MTAAASYRLRYFFDTGSGVCLWSANDAAHQRWGYTVDLDALPLTRTTRTYGHHLLAWHDTWIDWEHAPAVSRWWNADEARRFDQAVQAFLHVLRSELGDEFEILDGATAPEVV